MLVSMMPIMNAAMATNSAFAGMMAKQAITSLASTSANVAVSNASFGSNGNEFLDRNIMERLLHQEQKLSFSIINNELLYKIACIRGQEAKEWQKEDIKRTFSTFA